MAALVSVESVSVNCRSPASGRDGPEGPGSARAGPSMPAADPLGQTTPGGANGVPAAVGQNPR